MFCEKIVDVDADGNNQCHDVKEWFLYRSRSCAESSFTRVSRASCMSPTWDTLEALVRYPRDPSSTEMWISGLLNDHSKALAWSRCRYVFLDRQAQAR